MNTIKNESHGSVSSVAQCSFARDAPLSDPEFHGSVSSVVQCSFAETTRSLVWSL